MYWLMVFIPAIVLAGLASLLVKTSFAKWSKVPNSSGRSGAEAAAFMLGQAGLGNVQIERSRGMLSDHYDPRSRTLRLSDQVYDGRSVASIGVALHEAGHALQHAQAYAPLVIRNTMVPVAAIGGSYLPWILIMIGLFMNMTGLAIIGLAIFAVAVVFTLITLPVEFDASKRAKAAALQFGLVAPGREAAGVSSVLNAAALTYVAAAVVAMLNLLYYALLIFGRRS